VGRDGAAYGFDLGETRRNIFLQMGLDRKLSDLPGGQFRVASLLWMFNNSLANAVTAQNNPSSG
jgi:hypothetical protein